MTELKIIATMLVKTEYQQTLEKELSILADESRKEEGNLQYEIHRNTKNPLKYIVLETWASQEAIDKHNKSPHFLKFGNIAEAQLDILTINILEKIY